MRIKNTLRQKEMGIQSVKIYEMEQSNLKREVQVINANIKKHTQKK